MNGHLQQSSKTRRGFSLVEILVVIAIIAILAAMAGYAVFAMVGGQQRRNTESTIKVVHKILMSHWDTVVKEAKNDSPSPAVLALAQGDPARAKVLWIKFRLMEAFPQTYAEIGTTTLPGLKTTPWVYWDSVNNVSYIPSGQQRYIAGYQKLLGNAVSVNPLTESGACLRIALSVPRNGVSLSEDTLKYAILDTDGDGITELTDSFENPKQALAFFRFAWNYQTPSFSIQNNLNPAAASKKAGKVSRSATFADPVDTEGSLITNVSWMFIMPPGAPQPYTTPTLQRALFESQFHPVTNPYPLPPKTAPPYTACFNLPVIVSAGSRIDPKTNTRPFALNVDAKGHFLPEMSIDAAVATPFENDNIYSFQLTGN